MSTDSTYRPSPVAIRHPGVVAYRMISRRRPHFSGAEAAIADPKSGNTPSCAATASQGIAYVPYFPLGGYSPLQSDVLESVAKRLGATRCPTTEASFRRASCADVHGG
jgi:hypothetical protein